MAITEIIEPSWTPVADGSNTLVITYDVLIASNAQAGATITNTAILNNFTNTEGGPDFTAVDPTETASVALARPTVTKALISSEIEQPGNNGLRQATIGELVT